MREHKVVVQSDLGRDQCPVSWLDGLALGGLLNWFMILVSYFMMQIKLQHVEIFFMHHI